MKYKKGDILICKKSCRVPIGHKATVLYIVGNEIHMEWKVNDNYDEDGYVHSSKVNEYFYSKKELRKLKLEQLDEIR